MIKNNKKGLQLTMQVIVIVIILLVLLAFLLIFFTSRGQWLAGQWDQLVTGAINETTAAAS